MLLSDDDSPRSSLKKERLKFRPGVPSSLRNLPRLSLKRESVPSLEQDQEIARRFPHTFGRPVLSPFCEAHPGSVDQPLRVGVLFSGGPAAGGHNVIIGLFDALIAIHQDSQLYGFLDGFSGLLEERAKRLSGSELAGFRNQGGFDLIGSSRTKVESSEQLETCLEVFQKMQLDGLVVIGGDDSNTNVACLAEYGLKQGCHTTVVGVPKTIDGDLQNPYVDISFGFDTACRTYGEIIGNIARDAISVKKYTHFIKLMGRSSSHVALECALLTHPNMALIGEEVAHRQQTLNKIVMEIARMIVRRERNYGVILIPEGLVEFIPDMKQLINELNSLLASRPISQGEVSVDRVKSDLTVPSVRLLESLPEEVQKQLFFDRDPHGNVRLSQIESEKLFSLLVGQTLAKTGYQGSFLPQHHFLGYEGRAGLPTNFDATYCIALGAFSALLVKGKATGYMSGICHLASSPEHWSFYGIPLTSLMRMEWRKGREVPVIGKALVDLNEAPFTTFAQARKDWQWNDHYRYPGPIQFSDSSFLQPPLSLICKG